jgi:hypothetical protein
MTTPSDLGPQAARCAHCNRSSLSLLLLRPSPVAKAGPLVPPGASAVADAGALAQGLLPARAPTESRTVLRLLRAGFVHLYIPAPPAGVKPWHIWQVTEQGDFVAQTNPAFNPAMPPAVCARNDHNAAGMRLLPLPQGHKLSTVWIAYSANLWNDTLRARNAANPQVMQAVNLRGGGPNSFQPTAQRLQAHVLECALQRLALPGSAGQEFPFTSLAGQSETLASTLAAAAAAHPDTKRRELAVVLADPVGYASELNELRFRRFQVTQLEFAKPQNAHALASLQMIEGLRQSLVDEVEARKAGVTSPLMSRGAFQDLMSVKPNRRGWPEGTRWEPLTDRGEKARHGPNMGRVVFPDQEARASAWADKQSTITFDRRYRQYLNEPAIAQWKQQFEQHIRSAHSEPLARMEADWWAARQDARYNAYFAQHFDENDANAPRAAHSPGATYALEVQRSQTPQPFTEGALQEAYLAELRKRVHDTTAQGWRALVGNQAELFAHLDGYITSQRPDKIFDLSAGLFTALEKQLSQADIRYSWLAHARFGMSALSITQSWMATLAGLPVAAFAAHDMTLLSSALMVNQTLAMACDSAARGTWLRTPIRVSVTLPLALAQALTLMKERRAAMGTGADAPSNRSMKTLAGNTKSGSVTLQLLSDNHELVEVGGDLEAALGQGKGSVALTSAARASLPMTDGTLVVTASQFAQLSQLQPRKIQLARDAMSEMALLGKGGVLSLGGQIGLLGALLNGVGAWSSWEMYDKTGDLVALAGLADSVFGTVAGAAQVAEAAMTVSMANRLGLEVAQKTLPLLGAKVVTTAMGAAAGVALFASQMVKAKRASDRGGRGEAMLYLASAVNFAGLTATSSIQFVGAFSNYMLARGSKAAVWRLGAAAATGAESFLLRRGLFGLIGFGLTGWGLIFLAGGLAFDVLALALKPDALQRHVQRSRFGSGPDPYDSLQAEFAALDKLLGRSEVPSNAASMIPTTP